MHWNVIAYVNHSPAHYSYSFHRITDYSWNKETSFCCDSTQTHILLIQIQEKYRKSPSKGGSSFTFIIKGENTTDFCRVQDHFNGSYSVKCPLHESNVRITAQVNFAALNAFSSGVKPLHKTVWNFKIRDSATCPSKPLTMDKEYPQCTDWSAVDAVRSPGWWYKLNPGNWTWYTGQCVIPKPTLPQTATCVNSILKVWYTVCTETVLK